jgi:hypothetical protein
MKSFICQIGLHKYTSQELHCTENPNKTTFTAAILQHCDRCGESHITKHEMPTTIILSTKYILNK